MKRLFSILGLAALATVTASVARHLVSAPAAGEAAPDHVAVTISEREVPPGAIPTSDVVIPMSRSGGSSHVNLLGLDAEGGAALIHVQADVSLRDAVQFVWEAWAFDRDTREVVHYRRYDDQVTTKPAGVSMAPEFAEAIPLPPGAYFVRVQLMQVPPRGGLERLAELAAAVDDPNDVVKHPWILGAGGDYVVIE